MRRYYQEFSRLMIGFASGNYRAREPGRWMGRWTARRAGGGFLISRVRPPPARLRSARHSKLRIRSPSPQPSPARERIPPNQISCFWPLNPARRRRFVILILLLIMIAFRVFRILPSWGEFSATREECGRAGFVARWLRWRPKDGGLTQHQPSMRKLPKFQNGVWSPARKASTANGRCIPPGSWFIQSIQINLATETHGGGAPTHEPGVFARPPRDGVAPNRGLK